MTSTYDWQLTGNYRSFLQSRPIAKSNFKLNDSDWRRNNSWWEVGDQHEYHHADSCTAFATALGPYWLQGVYKGHFENEFLKRPSVRFLWNLAKEIDTDDLPNSFIERSGVNGLKASFKALRKHGCIYEEEMPYDISKIQGTYITNTPKEQVYTHSASKRISAYVRLIDAEKKFEEQLDNWHWWLAHIGPIVINMTFWKDHTQGRILEWDTLPDTDKGSFTHAAVIAGFANGVYILRNSYGQDWGDNGYVYLTPRYVKKHLKCQDAYGLIF